MTHELTRSDIDVITARQRLPTLDAESRLLSPAHPSRLRAAPTPPLRVSIAVLILIGLMMAGYLMVAPRTSGAHPPMTAAAITRADQGPRWIARRYFDELLTGGNLAVADELVAPGAVFHVPGPDLTGPAGIVSRVSTLRSAFPDAEFSIEDLIGDGDAIAARWSMRGTFASDFQGHPPTGNEATTTGITFLRIHDGRIVEAWDEYDLDGLLGQPHPASSSSGNDQPIHQTLEMEQLP